MTDIVCTPQVRNDDSLEPPRILSVSGNVVTSFWVRLQLRQANMRYPDSELAYWEKSLKQGLRVPKVGCGGFRDGNKLLVWL